MKEEIASTDSAELVKKKEKKRKKSYYSAIRPELVIKIIIIFLKRPLVQSYHGVLRRSAIFSVIVLVGSFLWT